MINVFTLFTCFVFFSGSLNFQVSFVNHRLYSVDLNGNQSLIQIFNLLSKQIDIDFWTQPNLKFEKFNFRISPKYQETLENVLNKNKVKYNLLCDNLEKWIEQEKIENYKNLSMSYAPNLFDISNFKFDYYHSYHEINEYLNYLEENHPEIAKVINIGETYENRAILGIKLGIPRNDSQIKPAFWIDAGIHAREWITPATAVYVIYKLTEKYDSDLEIKELMIKFDWYIFPIINPDGYVYSYWTNRLWRKNRALPKTKPIRFFWNLFNDCIGVDLNRNFELGYGGHGSSSNPCSEIFKGDFPFSEKESQAVRDTITKLKPFIKIFLSLHAYSQLWMSPYSYSSVNTKDHEELNEILKKVSKAVLRVNGLIYNFGTMANTIYPCGGTSVDWAYDKAKIKYSFTAELRDSGDFGFLLPRNQIIPTAQETWEGIKIIANEAKI